MNKQETRERVVVREVLGIGKQFLEEPGQHNAFLGLSLDRSMKDRHLELLVEWIIRNARHCPILIDDIEFRHNLMVFGSMNEEKATEEVLHRGMEMASKISGIVARKQYPYSRVSWIQSHYDDHKAHGVWVRRSSEEFDPRINGTVRILREAYENDTEFRVDVDTQVERSMETRLTSWKVEVGEEWCSVGKKQLANFVLEEAAVTIDFVRRDYPVELYPGNARILIVTNLYDPSTNKYPELRKLLNIHGEYGHISLGIEQIKNV